MLKSRPRLKLRFRLLNSVAKGLKAGRWSVARLDEETLCNEAIKKIGLSDFGHPHYREALLRLITAAEEEANLHFIGRIVLHGMIVMFLSNRLLLAEARKRTPEIFQQPLIPPIIILGLPRTGTTFLHRLLAADPAHRAIPLWELLRPLPSETPDRRREITMEGSKIQAALTPQHDRIHYARADSPEECVVLQGTTFRSALFPSFVPVYSYGEWHFSHDQSEAYREYCALLHVLQAGRPGCRLVLKAPAHAAALPTLFETIPDAMLIQTHRDPVTACNSSNSSRYSLQSQFAQKLDVRRLAQVNVNALAKLAATSLAFHQEHPGVIHDVQYSRLVRDPIGTVKDIYSRFNLAWSDAYEEQLRMYLRENPRGKHGEHRYSSVDFGLTDEAIARQFSEYSERFGVREPYTKGTN
jgi:hypothetical protein